MNALIFGEAASGKSEYAEALALRLAQGGPLVYLATMQAGSDRETQARVRRHRRIRAGKGFSTLECPRDLGQASLAPESTVLLEDLGNLAANTLFSLEESVSAPPLLEVLSESLWDLDNRTENLLVVSNDLCRDGVDYPEDTRRYLSLMEGLHRALAVRFDQVVEVVCGLPVRWKGERL